MIDFVFKSIKENNSLGIEKSRIGFSSEFYIITIRLNGTYCLYFDWGIGGGTAVSPGSSTNTGSLILLDGSPDWPFDSGKASLTVSFTVCAASSIFSLACVKFFFTDFVSGNASRTVCTASLT